MRPARNEHAKEGDKGSTAHEPSCRRPGLHARAALAAATASFAMLGWAMMRGLV